MSCCGNPIQMYPGAKRSGVAGPSDGDPRRRQFRRRQFFSNHLYRASTLVQDPKSITLREFAILAFSVYALYRGYFIATILYKVLAVNDVTLMCSGLTAMQCMRAHIFMCLWMVFRWLSQVVPWAIVGAVSVFFGEELLGAMRRKAKH